MSQNSNTMRMLLLLLGLLVLAGCTGRESERRSDLALPPARVNELIPLPHYQGKQSLEERIARSTIIARVRLRSQETVGAQRPGESVYVPAIKFTFDALEYLKGTGGSELVAYAYGHHYFFDLEESSAQKAKEEWGELVENYRDDRWDDQEAIIFLRQPVANGPYAIGELGEYKTFDGERVLNRVTVADDENQAWLPASSATSTVGGSGARGSASEQRFLLEDPADFTSTASAPASGASGQSTSGSSGGIPAVSETSLKEMIVAVEGEIAAYTSDPDAYRDCLIERYRRERLNRELEEQGRHKISVTLNLGSGLPADTMVDPYYQDPFTKYEREWYEGKDRALFTPRQNIMYTNRPLPQGEYRVYYNYTEQGVKCGDDPEWLLTAHEEIVQVTAPGGTLAESFFDPYADGTAVTGTTTVGTITWQSGKVTADLDIDVAGHALDFIALDSSVSLTLEAAEASTDGGALAWTVPAQPWSAGDKLMLRVRRSDATEATPTPTPTPTSTPTPIPTPTPTSTPTPTPPGPTPTPPESTPTPEPTPTPTPAPETEEPEISDIVARYDRNDDGAIDVSEYRQAVVDYGDGKITYSELLEVIRVYLASSG